MIKLLLKQNPTVDKQIELSTRAGGYGLRNPKTMQFASKISTLQGLDQIIYNYFPFFNETNLNNNKLKHKW